MTSLEKLADKLDWAPFVAADIPPMPTMAELQTVSERTDGQIVVSAILEQFYVDSSNHLGKSGIRPGALLRLKNGGLILVGHVSERLAYEDDKRFVALDEIAEIGYVY